MRTCVWAVAAFIFLGGVAYWIYREHRRSSVFLCNTENLWCGKGVCPGEGVGADCFERDTAWCARSSEGWDNCYAVEERCEGERQAWIRMRGRSVEELWQAGEAVGPCGLIKASEPL